MEFPKMLVVIGLYLFHFFSAANALVLGDVEDAGAKWAFKSRRLLAHKDEVWRVHAINCATA